MTNVAEQFRASAKIKIQLVSQAFPVIRASDFILPYFDEKYGLAGGREWLAGVSVATVGPP